MFKAKRIIHKNDLAGCPEAEMVFGGDGTSEWVINKARLIFTPGHTRGHSVLVWDNRFLFTGDHLPWSRSDQAFRPFAEACWFSWEEQIKSVEKLGALAQVERVLPGHGEPWHRDQKDFPFLIRETVEWMKR